MQGDANSANSQSLVLVVPRGQVDLCRSLSQSFGDDAAVQVVLDRRVTDRRVGADLRPAERRREDRRLRSDKEADLRAGRWIAVLGASGHTDLLDLDARAILFLCCSHHVVPCQQCQNTYRLRWISQAGPGSFACPVCGSDLTPTVVAHTQACRYWANHGTATLRRSRHAGPLDSTAAAATG